MNPLKTEFKRIFTFALSNIRRNAFLSGATITVIALIILSFNIILSINKVSNEVIEELSKKVDIILYLKDEKEFNDIEGLIDELKSFPSVKEAIYTSKENAFKEFLEKNPLQENPLTKFGIQNAFPASIQIFTNSAEAHQDIVSYLKNSQFKELYENIESDEQSQKIAEKLIHISTVTKRVLFGVTVAFVLGGIIIVLNSISLNIYSRRKEIQIMQFVGASARFIRLPFVIEGAIYGISGVVLNIFFFLIFKNIILSGEEIGRFLSQWALSGTLFLEAIISVLIGICSSQIAIHRYFTGK